MMKFTTPFTDDPRFDKLDYHVTEVESEHFTHVAFAYDRSGKRGWARDRAHFALGVNQDGWRIVVEVQSLDYYDPASDEPRDLTIAHVASEIIDSGPLLNLSPRSVNPAIRRSPSWPLKWPPPVEEESMYLGLKLVMDVVYSDERSAQLPLWYRLPRPATSPVQRGRSSRTPRELAEFAKLYLFYACKNPKSPIQDMAKDLAATGKSSQFWANLVSTVADAGYIEGRSPGLAGGSISIIAIDALDRHC